MEPRARQSGRPEERKSTLGRKRKSKCRFRAVGTPVYRCGGLDEAPPGGSAGGGSAFREGRSPQPLGQPAAIHPLGDAQLQSPLSKATPCLAAHVPDGQGQESEDPAGRAPSGTSPRALLPVDSRWGPSRPSLGPLCSSVLPGLGGCCRPLGAELGLRVCFLESPTCRPQASPGCGVGEI